MHRTRALPLAFVALLVFGASRHIHANRMGMPTAAAVTALRTSSAPEAGGGFPDHWIDGTACDGEPEFQVHAYNEDLFIIRQSKCTIFEAPFLYLIFGDDKVLLMDTGANPNVDVWGTVNRVVLRWLENREQAWIRMIVAHTHAHGDHIQGDSQFVDKPYVEALVGLSVSDVEEYWGFQDFPNDATTIDLGNRVLDVLGTPGHQAASLTLYDRRTRLLMTGDIVYPGHLFVFSQPDWTDFVQSLRRLVNFAGEHPVEWVVGCHIEMSDRPFGSFAWGTPQHPNEHVLEFPPEKLLDIYEAALSMDGDPECTIFDEFVIHPVYKCGIFWNGD